MMNYADNGEHMSDKEMNGSNIKISIITICLNNLLGLKKTMESVLLEYVIVDGGSEDGTYEFLKNSASDNSNIIYVSETDRGRSDAFNKGTKMASGDLVLYLNSGDYFLRKTVVSEAVSDWRKKPVDVIGYNVMIDSGGTISGNEDRWQQGLLPHQGLFIRREVVEKVGFYNKYLVNRMDYDIFLRFYEEGCTHRFIDSYIVCFNADGISSTNRHNFRLEGAGLKLIYKKRISKEDIETLMELYMEEGGKRKDFDSSAALQRYSDKTDGLTKKYVIMRSLLTCVCDGISLTDFFDERSLKTVAIYGMGDVGNVLYKLLKSKGINIPYCIDRDADKKIYGIEIRTIREIGDDIDAIIVSNVVNQERIKEEVSKYCNYPIYTVNEILQR